VDWTKGTIARGARFGLMAAALALLAACGKTAQEDIAARTPEMQALRGKLNTIVGGLPSFGSAVTMSMAAVDPKPVYDVRNPGEANTAFVSAEQLRNDAEPPFNLNLTSDLSAALAWTGANNPLAPGRLAEPSGEVGDAIAHALETPYVVIYRTVSYEKPVATADGTGFDGGLADFEAFVVSVERNTWIASCRVQAESAQQVTFSYKKGEDPKARLEAFAHSTLRDDVLAKLAACLNAQTGGTFTLSSS
jgi:hypothetical protein